MPREYALIVASTLLDRFVREEAEHQQLWQRLNRASEPYWYADGKRRFVQISKIASQLIGQVLCRPDQWTVVFWLMLALEERSMEISRRCLRVGCYEIEPHYQAAYALHRDDEALHIQIDRFLIEKFFVNQSSAMRSVNACLFRC